MKRKVMIYLVAGTTFLSAFGGVASILATGPNPVDVEPTARIQQTDAETPILIAVGCQSGDKDEKESEESKQGCDTQNGNSWGG